MTIQKVRDRIDEFVEIDSSEIQEAYNHLSILYDSYQDYIEDELVDAIENEFYEILAYYEENWEIEEKMETVPEFQRTYKKLVQKFD